MNPSSSSIAKTLLPLVANEDHISSPLAHRLRAVAEQLQQRKGRAYKDLLAKDSSEPLPSVMYYRTNQDGSVVTMDSAGRATALENRAGKRLYSYRYNNTIDLEPNRIELSDGTVFEKRFDVGISGVSHAVWLMKSSSNPETTNLEFSDAVLTIDRDGSFAIKYKCQIASSIKREPVVREICYNARGKKVVELVKSTCTRVGPGNSATVKEIYVRQKSIES